MANKHTRFPAPRSRKLGTDSDTYFHQSFILTLGVKQAFRLVALCAKSFQRATRQLANIRLVRAETARARRRERVKTLKPVNKVA